MLLYELNPLPWTSIYIYRKLGYHNSLFQKIRKYAKKWPELGDVTVIRFTYRQEQIASSSYQTSGWLGHMSVLCCMVRLTDTLQKQIVIPTGSECIACHHREQDRSLEQTSYISAINPNSGEISTFLLYRIKFPNISRSQ